MHAPCLVVRQHWNISYKPSPSIRLELLGSFSHTQRDGTCLVVRRLGSLSNTPRSTNSVRSWGRESLLDAVYWKLSDQSECG